MNTSKHRRNIPFSLRLLETDREHLDDLAKRMGVSRTEVIARGIRLLDILDRKAHPDAQTRTN